MHARIYLSVLYCTPPKKNLVLKHAPEKSCTLWAYSPEWTCHKRPSLTLY